MSKRRVSRRGFQALGVGFAVARLAPAWAQSASRDLVIGQVASMSGSNGADLGLGLQLGIKAVIDPLNARGGINGRMIRFVSLDDRYIPDETVRLTKELIVQHKPVALIGYRGTANTMAVVKARVLEESGVPLVGTLTGAAEVQGAPMIYHVRTSYLEEISQLVLQISRLGISRIGLFYADDVFGKSGREAVLNALGPAKLSLIAEASYDRAPERVEGTIAAAVEKLNAAQPQAVIMLAVGDPAYSFVTAAKAKSAAMRLFSISVVNPSTVIDKVGLDAAKGMAFSQVFPYPYSDASPLAREYRDALRNVAAQAAPSYFSIEGYVYAKVLADAIRRAGVNPTAASVKAALDATPPHDIGGFTVRFRPETRNGSAYSDLTVIGSTGKLMK